MYGKHLKELRESKNISQEMVAEELNISRQAISRWENDKAFPDIENLKLLSKLYEVSIDELVGVNEGRNSSEKDDHKYKVKESEQLIFNNNISAVLMITIIVCSCWVFPVGVIVSIVFLHKSKELKTKFWIWAIRLICLAALIFCLHGCYTIAKTIFIQGNTTIEYLG